MDTTLAPSRVAPGPRGVPVLGSIPSFWPIWGKNQIYVHMANFERYGDVVRYEMGPRTMHLLRHPDDAKHVLTENAANYTKGRGIAKLRAFLGDGLLTSEGALWKRQRKLAQPAFHQKRLQQLVGVMTEATAHCLNRWDSRARARATMNVAAEMTRLTLTIVAETLFGSDVSADADSIGGALTVALDYTNRRLLSLVDLPPNMPTPDNLRFAHAKRTLDRVVYGIIDARRKSRADEGDLLSMLMLARDEETNEAMSDEQLRDEVMTLFLAGHETTANALAWTWYLLSKEPVVWRALKDEIDRVLADRTPTFEDLPKLAYTRMVIEEAMRLYPPVWMFGRRAIADDDVRGYRIPAGSLVGLCPYYTHRHPDYWPNPEGFDPTRFGPEASAGRPKHAYLPFGGGPRICIGNAFAIFEAQVIVAMTMQRYRLDLVPGPPIEPEPLVTLRPKGGVHVTVHAL